MKRSRVVLAASLTALVTVAALITADRPWSSEPAREIDGPYARLLSDATDLGPARDPRIQLTAALRDNDEPVRLSSWAQVHGLSVRWREGDDWAIVEGSPAAIADALGVVVHDYRDRQGIVFYASPQQPPIPAVAHAEVAEFGRILSRTPHREGLPPTPPRDVPDGGLLPTQLWKAYDATELTDSGYTGKGQTVVVFSFDGFKQKDMDTFSEWFDVPKFTPEVVGGMPAQITGESTMDLQVIHAVAPDARLVMVNARSTVEAGGTFEKVAQLMESMDSRFPGAIWSLSIGWGCDRLFTAADLAPVRAALAAAHKHGTTAFDATGDLAGLECKGGHDWADPPSPDDVGVDAVASIPEMTAVGGTTLSTDAQGGYLGEQGWYDVPLTQGSAGGASVLFGQPSWQVTGSGGGSKARRLVPDVSAVGDPFTGVKFVIDQQVAVGGGTSQSAPIWAGLGALMNQLLKDQGADPLGDLNPLLYAVAKGSATPGFRDIQLGGNAITVPHPGYDMVTGLGSPSVVNLIKGILLTRSLNR
ncbi:MAG: S53 family peptidase [Mycobacterium sp.]